MKKVFILAVAFLLLFTGCGKQKNETTGKVGTTDKKRMNEKQIELMEKHPGFFGLDASGGLDVLVCQFAPEHYSLALTEHSETPRDMTDPKMWNLDGVYAREMKEILATYPVGRDDVHIIPWQNPVSSYIADYFFFTDDKEADAERKQAYTDKILDMLFDETGTKFEVYDHSDKKDGKKRLIFFTDSQAKDLRDRKERGELFTLTYDEVKYIVDDSIWKYDEYDEIVLTGAGGYGIVPDDERQRTVDHHISCIHEDISKLPFDQAKQKYSVMQKDLYIIITYRLSMLDSSFVECELYRTNDSKWITLDGAPATLISGDGKYGLSSIDVDPPIPESKFFLKSFAEADGLEEIIKKTAREYGIFYLRTFPLFSSYSFASEEFKSEYYDGIRNASMEAPLLMTRYSEEGCNIAVFDYDKVSSRLFPNDEIMQRAPVYDQTGE